MNLAEAAVSRLVPAAFRDFLPLVSPSGLRVIHKEKVLALAIDAAASVMRRAKYDEDFVELERAVRASPLQSHVELTKTQMSPLDVSALPSEVRKKIGKAILMVYFFMIREPLALHLDLRPTAFGWDITRERLVWQPSRLRTLRSADFSERIRGLYRGFFERSESGTEAGIALYRWEATPTEGFDSRMEALMRKHFGDAESSDVLFSTSNFRETFHLMFEEAIASRTRFHPELTLLGTTLAGLYVTLEKVGVPLDVAGAYREIFR
jgi:hypothetical protein